MKINQFNGFRFLSPCHHLHRLADSSELVQHDARIEPNIIINMKQNRASAHQEARLILQSGASADNIANTFDGNAFCPIDQLLSIKSRMVVRCPDQQQRRRQQECLLSRLYAMGSTYNGILQMSYVSMVFMLIAANWICAANANNEPINGVNGAADTSTSTEFGKFASIAFFSSHFSVHHRICNDEYLLSM